MCKRCETYGTFCNYDSRYFDLQPLAHRSSHVQILRDPLNSTTQTTLNLINTTSLQLADSTHLAHGAYQFSIQDLELVHKFHTRTTFTLGTGKNLQIYQNAYAKLVCSVRHAHTVFLLSA